MNPREKKMNPAEKLYTVEEIAAVFEVHIDTVYAWLRGDRLRGIRVKSAKKPRITRWYATEEAVKAFAQERYGA